MNFKEFLSKAQPHIIAILIFYGITFSFFLPEFVDNLGIQQSDVVQFEGMAKESLDYLKETNEQALWTGAMFSGTPTYLISTGVPDFPLNHIQKLFFGLIPNSYTAFLMFLSLVCFYIGVLCFNLKSPYVAILGSIAFAFASYNIINMEVGHVTKVMAVSYSVLVIGGLHLMYANKILAGFALFTLGLTFEIRASHYQITYYLAFICLVYVIYAEFRNKFDFSSKALLSRGLLLVGSVLALSASAGKLLIMQEYTKYSTRGPAELISKDNSEKKDTKGLDKDYAFSWSQGKFESFTLLLPNLYGGSSHERIPEDFETVQLFKQGNPQMVDQVMNAAPMYWGDQPFTAGPIYAGVVVFILAIFYLFFTQHEQRKWIIVGIVISLILAWGRNFETINYFLFDYFPGFNKFRSVSMALSLTTLLLAISAVLGVNELLKIEDKKMLWKPILSSVAVTISLLLIAVIGANLLGFQSPQDGSYQQELREALIADRSTMVTSDLLRALFFIALLIGCIYVYIENKINQVYVVGLLTLLLLLDNWTVAKRYLPNSKFINAKEKAVFTANEADNEILKDTDLSYRVLNLNNPFNEARTSYFHKSIGGYFAAKLHRYQDLIERQFSPEIQGVINDINQRSINFSKYPVLNMLNTRYIMFGESKDRVIKNNKALGNAWFIDSIQTVNSPLEEIESLAEVFGLDCQFIRFNQI